MSLAQVRVAHDVGAWLPRTKAWLYGLVAALPEGVESWVVASRTLNGTEFPYPRVVDTRQRSGTARWLVEMGMRRLGWVRHCPSIHAEMKRLRPDVLHSHFGTVGWANLQIARTIGARHVVSFYGFDVSRCARQQKWRKRYLEMFPEVDTVLCEGEYMRQSLIALGCPADKVVVYRLGVDIDDLSSRLFFWQPGQVLRLLMAASFNEKKGLPYGLEAIGVLAERRTDLEIRVMIVGGESANRESRAIAGQLRELERRFGLSVEWPGFCSHRRLVEIAAASDIFVSPSVTASDGDNEGGAPVSILEMAAMGLPVVSTRHCDIPGCVGPVNRGLLAAERDVEGLVHALTWLVDHPDSWREIATENRLHIEQLFSRSAQGTELASIYKRLVAGK